MKVNGNCRNGIHGEFINGACRICGFHFPPSATLEQTERAFCRTSRRPYSLLCAKFSRQGTVWDVATCPDAVLLECRNMGRKSLDLIRSIIPFDAELPKPLEQYVQPEARWISRYIDEHPPMPTMDIRWFVQMLRAYEKALPAMIAENTYIETAGWRSVDATR